MQHPSDSDDPITVGVVMPTYNGAPFLRRQVDSILNQTRPPDRIVLVDDGSTDQTPAILSSYGENHSHVDVHINATNIGWIKNFEKALALCDADIIAVADQDDLWRPDKIEQCVAAMSKETGPVLCYHDASFIDAADTPLNTTLGEMNVESYPVPDHRLRQSIADTCTPIPGFLMVINRALREAAVPFPGRTFCPHDWWLNAIGVFLGTVVFIDEPLVAHRLHAGQTIGDFRSRLGRKKEGQGGGIQALFRTWSKLVRESRRVVQHRKIQQRKRLDAQRRSEEFSIALERLVAMMAAQGVEASAGDRALLDAGLARLSNTPT